MALTGVSVVITYLALVHFGVPSEAGPTTRQLEGIRFLRLFFCFDSINRNYVISRFHARRSLDRKVLRRIFQWDMDFRYFLMLKSKLILALN